MIEHRGSAEADLEPKGMEATLNGYTPDDIEAVIRQFQVSGAVLIGPFDGRGNINLHTYEVLAAGEEYLLQKVNSYVFTMPERVMEAMLASIEAQRIAIEEGRGDDLCEPIRLVPTRSGEPYLDQTDHLGRAVWRLMVRIPKAVAYKSLSEVRDRETQLRLAEEVGRGLAIYSDLTSSIDPDAVSGSLPGYRDTGLYYRQFHSIMAGHRTLSEISEGLPSDPTVRKSTQAQFVVALDEAEYARRKSDPQLAPFIELVREQELFTMGLWNALAEGRIRRTLIHGDTKLENFLFCPETGRVKSLVDLDTIMPFTWLADWGDMLRSLVNVAGEKERNLDRVVIDREVYEAVAKGFLESAREVTEAEVALMVFAVEAISLELGLRFLTDYLRGDTYFQLADDDPPDINKVRAMVQLTLYRRLREFQEEAAARLARYRAAAGAS